ncbi:MAG: UrcA family protein [Steroidobacteraceae bacterium]
MARRYSRIPARLVIMAAVVALPAAGRALAGGPPRPDDGRRVAVRYADLNLASTRDAATLMRRIELAARQVCGTPSSGQPLGQWTKERSCIASAVRRAVAEVASEKLTLAYRTHDARGRASRRARHRG